MWNQKINSNQRKEKVFKRCLINDHVIIIAHTEPRPDELENKIRKGPFNKIKFILCEKENGKNSRDNPKSDWNQFVIFRNKKKSIVC